MDRQDELTLADVLEQLAQEIRAGTAEVRGLTWHNDLRQHRQGVYDTAEPPQAWAVHYATGHQTLTLHVYRPSHDATPSAERQAVQP